MLVPTRTSNATRTHVVRPDETLAGISHRYGLDWRTIARLNGVSDPKRLQIGTVLRLSGAPALAPRVAAPRAPQVPTRAPRLPAVAHGPIARPNGGGRLGDLSMRYETGFRPGQEAQAAAVVSTGADDPGGVSYGAYQLTSTVVGSQQVQAFLRWHGLPWAARFHRQDATARGGAFGTTWRRVAAENPHAFFEAQHSYIERTHYSPTVTHVQRVTALDVNTRSRAVQNVVWSMSVQHGRAPRLVARAVNELGPQGDLSDVEYDRNLINRLYDIRSDYVAHLRLGRLRDRYTQERRDALRQLEAR